MIYNVPSPQQAMLHVIDQLFTAPHAIRGTWLLAGKCKFKSWWERNFTRGPRPFVLGSDFKFPDVAVNLERKHMETRWQLSQTAKQILCGFRARILQGVSTATQWSRWLTFVLNPYAEELRHDRSSVSCFHSGAHFPAVLEKQMLLTNMF